MPWFKIDDGFHGHPKVVELSLAAVGIWTLAGSWCAKYLTDGAVSSSAIRRMGGDESLAAELVAADLWLDAEDGFEFKDWADYQPLKVDVEAERLAAQERMKKVRAAKKGVRANDSRTTSERSGEQPANFGRSSDDVRIAPSQSQSHPSPSTSKEVDRAPKPTRKQPDLPLPDAWVPSASNREYATANGIDLEHEAGQFRAHAAANDRRQKNWDMAFRQWLGNAKQWAKPGRAAPMAKADANAAAYREIYGGDPNGGARSVPALDAGFSS